MEKKILKLLLIIFIVLLAFTIGLIGYRASIVAKIAKARNDLFASDNVRIEVEMKESEGQVEKEIIERKGNLEKVTMFYNIKDDAPSNRMVFDLENNLQIDLTNKTFYIAGGVYEFMQVWYRYPVFPIIYPEDYEKTLKDRFDELSYFAILVLKGYPHYIIDDTGREAISMQLGNYLLYFDKETGLCYERYQLKEDGSKEKNLNYSVQFGTIADEDVDYGELSEYYQVVAE